MIDFDVHYKKGDFTLSIAYQMIGGIAAVIGPSGAGKSTMLALLAGSKRPISGHLTIGGRSLYDGHKALCVPPHQRSIAMVFQNPMLFPHMTAGANIDYARARSDHPMADTSVEKLYTLLGITDLLARAPASLSGGEAQRVALARALIGKPDLLLLDEPLAALDPARRHIVIDMLRQTQSVTGTPILVVSHDWPDVARLADQVLLIEQGQKVFAGDVNTGLSMAKGAVSGVQYPGPNGPVFLDADDVMLALEKPEGLSATLQLPAEIIAIQPAADSFALVMLKTEQGPVTARLTQESVARLGLEHRKNVYAIIKSAALR